MKDNLKILIVSPRLPYATGKADSMTVYFLTKYLAERGHKVCLVTLYEEQEFTETRLNDLKKHCERVETYAISPLKSKMKVLLGFFSRFPAQNEYYYYSSVKKEINLVIDEFKPDIIYSHLIRVAKYVEDRTDIPRILAMQISQTLNLKRMKDNVRKLSTRIFYQFEYRKVKKYEPYIIPKFERVLLISPNDQNSIDPNNQFNHIFFNPHGIDVSYYAKEQNVEKIPNSLVMNGDFGTPTNIDAILYFYEEIYPLVKLKVPDVKLYIVGRNPAPEVKKLEKDQSVTVTGRIEDIRPYLHQASVAIDPLRIGAGLQNKILVSLAAELPVVSTKIANEGINAPENEVILIADGEQKFADKVIHLLENKEERERIGRNAQKFMFEKWTWEYHFEQLEHMISDLLENGGEKPVVNYYPFED